MKLFDVSDLVIPPETPKKQHNDSARRVDAKSTKVLLARHIQGKRLATLIPEIEPGAAWHIIGAGSWSNFDLIEHLAAFAAPAELWLSTWGISDPGARAVDRMLSSGLVTAVHCVLDNHTAVQHSGATAFLQSLATRLGILPCHAKAYILLGQSLNISVITSANLTNNPYLEAGVITESRQIAEFHRDWIDRAIRRASPFEAPDDEKKRK